MTSSLAHTSQLDKIAKTIVTNLAKTDASFKTLFNVQVDLLKFFDHQIDLLETLGYCDYELAYVVYMTCIHVLLHLKQKTTTKTTDIFNEIQLQTRKKATSFKTISGHFSMGNEQDPLLDRFQSLSGANGNVSKTNVGFREWITPTELHEDMKTHKILLIDYRPLKSYLNNHIMYADLVHIDPKALDKLSDTATDMDLENALEKVIPREQYEKFLERHKYEHIVIYNYQYGSLSTDRYTGLLDVLGKSNPFTKLIGILMNNKYISSRLKVRPSFLSGGVFGWHKVFGDASLERTIENGTVTSVQHQYLTSFNDYVSKTPKTAAPQIATNGNYIRPAVTPKVDNTSLFDPVPVKSVPTVYASKKVEPPLPPTPKSPPLPPKQPQPKQPTTSKQSHFLESYTTGLTNLGNSCYMNCVVQCLAATPQLTSFFFPSITESLQDHSYKQHINVNNKLGTQGMLTTSFVELILNMLRNNGKSFSPSKFKKIMGGLSPGGQFATYNQQDCVEFLNFLLDALHEDLNQVSITDPNERKKITELSPEQEKSRETLPPRLASTIEWERYLKLNFSVIVDYFQGQHLSQLKCLQCGFTSTTYNAFSILSLPIPQKLNLSEKVTLQECLREFVATELLDDDNKWYCPQCEKFTRSTKTIAITRLPQVLIVNFNRFKMTSTGGFNKLETFVTYPVNEVLDLTPYWADVGSTVNTTNNMTVEQERELLKSFPTRNQSPPFKYKLFGVANHFGNLTTGHYTSYVYKESDAKRPRNWCYFDDSKVTFNVSPKEVVNKNAYCLFFQRV
ncbi:LOW QUALITY PROTEIN: DOA4 Ubiquitin carboxyl-terminal hydrolase 4 [Candida maltosa Xu316]